MSAYGCCEEFAGCNPGGIAGGLADRLPVRACAVGAAARDVAIPPTGDAPAAATATAADDIAAAFEEEEDEEEGVTVAVAELA